MTRPALLALALLVTWPSTMAAQEASTPASLALLRPNVFAPEDSTRPTWVPTVSSLIIPGSGQLMLGQERGAIYLVVEAFLIARFFRFYSEGSRESDRYRELAYTVARSPFNPSTVDTAFSYFETLQDFRQSGPFDTDPGPDLAPPMDERTFNGSIWELARQTFFVDPDSLPDPSSEEYQRALEFYRERAVGPNFLWSWRNAGLEQDLYRQSIQRSDEAFRRATTQLGLLLVNHLLSGIDAFISSRVTGNRHPVDVGSAVQYRGDGTGLDWHMTVQVGF
jgi:hypothetical protein